MLGPVGARRSGGIRRGSAPGGAVGLGRRVPERPAPNGPFRASATRARMPLMQVLPSTRAKAGRPPRLAPYTALFAGALFPTAGVALLYLVFGGAFMTRFMPSGRPSTYDLVVGALAWTFALTAPAGFGLVGVARLGTAYERWRARRPRITPAVRLRRAIGDDHVVATSVRLPVGNR